MKSLLPLLLLPTASARVIIKKGKSSKNAKSRGPKFFNRKANFFVCDQPGSSCDDVVSASNLVSSSDGQTLIYTDEVNDSLGFVDVSKVLEPKGLGTVDVDGRPVGLASQPNGECVAVTVDTSADYVNTGGKMQLFNITDMSKVFELDVGGQPRGIAWSPDAKYMVINIENQRDPNLGGLPQMPAGFSWVVDTSAEDPASWTVTKVTLTGLDGLTHPEDPEPNSVVINEDNTAAVTLPANNAIVIINLHGKNVTSSFSAGTTDLKDIDTVADGIIDPSGKLYDQAREPSSVAWLGKDEKGIALFATADQGDIGTGTRGFTVFDTEGKIRYDSKNEIENIVASLGHYPEYNAGESGNAPVTVEVGHFFRKPQLFVISGYANLALAYDITDPANPVYRNALPTGSMPQGAVAITNRNPYIFATASHADSGASGVRSIISLFPNVPSPLGRINNPKYPMLQSTGSIPWSSLSGLCRGKYELELHAISGGIKSQIFKINTEAFPYDVIDVVVIKDSDQLLSPTFPHLVNDDKTVNLPAEGIALDNDDNFWVVVEGTEDPATPNLLVKVKKDGKIEHVSSLPVVNSAKLSGIAFMHDGTGEDSGFLAVCFQQHPTMWRYDVATNLWNGQIKYEVDAPESAAGGYVSITDMTYLNNTVMVLESDNQGGRDAAVKRIYSFNPHDYTGSGGETITKTLVIDLLDTLIDETDELVPEKLEGLAAVDQGVFLLNDNSGVYQTYGSTFLWNLGNL